MNHKNVTLSMFVLGFVSLIIILSSGRYFYNEVEEEYNDYMKLKSKFETELPVEKDSTESTLLLDATTPAMRKVGF